VIIWLTDNLANVPAEWMSAIAGQRVAKGTLHTEQEALRSLYESGTVVSALLKRSPWAVPVEGIWMAIEAPWRARHPPGNAKKYAELTGGEALQFNGKKPDERLAELIDDLRSRYTIGFRPSADKPAGTFSKLRVIPSADAPLRSKEWSVLATAGYYRP